MPFAAPKMPIKHPEKKKKKALSPGRNAVEFNVKPRTSSLADKKTVRKHSRVLRINTIIPNNPTTVLGPPPPSYRPHSALRNAALEASPSYSHHLPPTVPPPSPSSHPASPSPIINLDESTNYCLACSICLPRACTGKEKPLCLPGCRQAVLQAHLKKNGPEKAP